MTLTIEEFKSALPDKMKKSVSQELVDRVNSVLSKPEEFAFYRDNLISYASVLRDGKFKIEQYLDAVRYVSFKLMGCTNIDAYTRAFPDKYQKFLADGVEAKDIASYVSAYNKGKLVNLVFEQSLIPAHVLNQDLFQRALNVQAELMVSAASEKVRCEAANSLLTHLKPPEVKKVELDIGVKEDSSIASLRKATMELAEQQRQMIASGMINAQAAAHSQVVIDMGDADVVAP